MGKEQHSADLFQRLTEGAAGPGPKFCEQMLARYIETLEQSAQRLRNDKAAAEVQVRHLRNELWRQGVEAANHRARAERAEADVKTLFALLVDGEAARSCFVPDLLILNKPERNTTYFQEAAPGDCKQSLRRN